ncbi:MAG: T9SS type A sorting domain-containing protein [Flavobacteriales bacterium]|nr:MAG: T9SS type A sorting domain-containing protein [Flavobacteriales bacterium]
MKKNYLLTLLLSFLFAVNFQAQVVVGEGTVVNEEMPIEPYYKFSYSQVIYHASEINASGTITGLKYTATQETDLANSDGWDIWIGHTSLDQHEVVDGTTTVNWVDISELTQVFSGTVTITDQEVSVTLDTPFEYNGTDNLLVAVNETSNVNNEYDGSDNDFYCTATTGVYRGLVNYSDTGTGDFTNPAPIDPSNPPAVTSGSRRQSYANITFEGITQSCSNPSGFSVDNILGTTADVSWTSASDYGWEYIILTSEDDAPGDSDSGTAVSEASVSLSGLTPVTDYMFYARTVCASENSAWIGFAFTTACADLFELPFLEGFNSVTPAPSETEICWTILDLSPAEAPNNASWVTGSAGSFAFEGDQGASLYTNNNQGKNDDYLITPRLNLTGNDRLKFAAKSWDEDDTNSMEVLISSTGNAAEDFTIVVSELTEYAAGDSWTEVSIDLSAYTGAHYIAFHVPPTDGDGYYMMLDAVVVEVNPTCDTPLNVAISNLTSSSADASWEAGATGETEWEYVLQASGDPDPTGSGIAVSTNSVTLDGLTQGDEYDFYVRAICGTDNYSEWTPLYGVYFMIPPVGGVCTDPIVIDTLPYSTTDTTANYQDDYEGSAGENCNESAAYYLNGDDVVYAYTATSDTSINVSMSPDATYSGIFVYDSCDDIGVECVAGIGESSSNERVFDMNVYVGTTYYFVISTWASPQSVGYDLVITENTCTDPVIEVANVDCSEDQFSVEFNVTDMGSSTLLTMTDDLGNVQYAQTTGVLTFGPYTGADAHVITVEGDDPNCNQTYVVTNVCNDECTGALPLEAGQEISGDTSNATDSGNNPSNDLWYSYTGNGESDEITISLCGSSYDTYIRIFDSCTGDQIVYNDDACGLQSEITFTSDGTTTYYIMVEGYSANNGAFVLSVSSTLGVDEIDLSNLKIYPNPVDGNYVTIKSPIGGDKQIELFDINGRRVLSSTISGDMLDVSSINAGFYMIKVTVNDYQKVSKLIIK